jgi:hypothetical protein
MSDAKGFPDLAARRRSVIARSAATKQSRERRALCVPWIASLALAMTNVSNALTVARTAVAIDGGPLKLS